VHNIKKLVYIIFVLLSGCSAVKTSYDTRNVLSPVFILKENINRLLNTSELESTVTAIKITNLSKNEVIFQSNSNKLLHPASTNKLFTAAAGFYYLKPDFTFKTKIYTNGAINNKTLSGNLYIKGAGDPDLKTEHLEYLAQSLKSKIEKIEGDIIGDESLFDDMRKSSGWMWDDGPYKWWPPISALTVNDNCIELHISPGEETGEPLQASVKPDIEYMTIINNATVQNQDNLTISQKWMDKENSIEINGTYPPDAPEITEIRTVEEPALYAVHLFKKVLKDHSIECSGTADIGVTPENAVELTYYESEPLISTIKNFLKTSDNLTGEMLVKKISSFMNKTQGSTEQGIALIKKFLAAEVGLDTLTFSIADGSGVSRYNLVSPAIEVELLTYIYNNEVLFDLFKQCLPIGGIDLRETSFPVNARRRVYAKPGSITGVSSLAGYVFLRNREIIAFSMIMSGFVDSSLIYQNLQNEILRMIVNYSREE